MASSANSALTVPWPPVFSSFLNSMKVALLDLLTTTQAGCAAPMTFYDGFGLTMGIFGTFGVEFAPVHGFVMPGDMFLQVQRDTSLTSR